jgi:hypothetical protein
MEPATLIPYCITPEAEFLVEKPGTKTGLLPGLFVFSSQHLLSGNAQYFWSFASFSSRFLQFVSFSSCFEEGTRVSFSSHFVKRGYCFQVSDSEKVTTSSKKKMVTTFSRDQKSRLRGRQGGGCQMKGVGCYMKNGLVLRCFR